MSGTVPPGAGVLKPAKKLSLEERIEALEAWRDGTVAEAEVQARVAREVRVALGLPPDASDAEVQAAQARARGEAPPATASSDALLPDWVKRGLIWLVMGLLYALLARLGVIDPSTTPPPKPPGQHGTQGPDTPHKAAPSLPEGGETP